MSKVLICTVGLPRSGKSTWARSYRVALQDGSRSLVPIVCPDSIRYALHGERYKGRAEDFVWAIARVMVRALFLAGHEAVILDATGITRKRRDGWRSHEWTLCFKEIDTSMEVCLERAREEGDSYIIPIIELMAEEFEPLGDDELRFE